MSEAPPGISHRIGVLLVEDEVLVRADMAETLQMAGLQVYEADTAIEGLDVLDAYNDIRVLITDVTLERGEATGFHLAKVVAERHPSVGILILSGGALPVGNERPPRARFLTKPCEPRSLVAEVFNMVDTHAHDRRRPL